MIKFFRKIRLKLLSENKVSKYLLYAIGEIVLVIIGILIALSININIENRKRQNEIKDFLNIIKNDVSTDVIAAKEIKIFRDSSKYHSFKSLGVINSNLNLGIQDFEKVLSTEYNPNFGKMLSSNKNAFNALISSGLMAKIKNPNINSAIIDYYKLIEEVEKKEVQMNDNLRYINRELFLEVGSIELYDYFSSPKLILKKHQIWFSNFVNSHFLQGLHMANLDDLGIKEGYSELIKKGEQLIKLLESEFD